MKLMSQERLHLESVMMNSLCHWRGQIAGILSRCLCHLFPTIITRKLRKLLKNLRQPCRSANFMYTGIRRHVSVAPQRAALQSSYTIENNIQNSQNFDDK